MGTNKLVWATQVKFIVLQVMGGEEGVLSMALNIHVHATRMIGMFVQRKQQQSVYDDSAVIRREARLLRQPNWIASFFFRFDTQRPGETY